MGRIRKGLWAAFVLGTLAFVASDPRTTAAAQTLIRGSQIMAGTVTATQLATAVTSLLLPSSTTKGNVVAASGSAWTALAVGTDGQALVADSTQTLGVKWGTVSGGGGGSSSGINGGLVLLDQQVASSSASLNFTTRTVGSYSGAIFQSDFDEYVVEFINIQPATNAVGLQVRMSTNGGSSWASGASDYRWSFMAYGSGGPGNTNSTGATSVSLIGFANISNNALNTTSGYIRVFNPLSTTSYKMLQSHQAYWDSTPTLVTGEVVGAYQSATAVNAIQLFASSGNIASGAARIYGVDKTGAGGNGAGAGGLVLVEQHAASSSATLDFTQVSSTYDQYVFEMVDVIPATAGVDQYMRFSTDGGATYDSTSKYASTIWAYNGGGGTAATGSTIASPAGQFAMRQSAEVGNGATYGISGRVSLYAPASTATYKRFIGDYGYMTNSTDQAMVRSGGVYMNTAAVNAVRFLMSSGNITSGTIRMYGVSKATGAGAAAAGKVLLEQHAASASATLDFTTCLSSAYDDYEFAFVNVVPATNTTSVAMRLSTDGGATFDTGSNYRHGFSFSSSANTGGTSGSNSETLMTFMGTISNVAADGGGNGYLRLFNPGSATMVRHMEYGSAFKSSDGNFYQIHGGGEWVNTTTAANAARFLMSSGNIASGTIRCYGIAK
jgi:hypothetical protein